MARTAEVNKFLQDLASDPNKASDYAKLKTESTDLAAEIEKFLAAPIPFLADRTAMENHGAAISAVVNKYNAAHPAVAQQFADQASTLKAKLIGGADVTGEISDLRGLSQPPLQDPAQIAAEAQKAQQEAAERKKKEDELAQASMPTDFWGFLKQILAAVLGGGDFKQMFAGILGEDPQKPATPPAPGATTPAPATPPAPAATPAVAALSPEAAAAAQAAAGGLAPVDAKAAKITVQAPAGVVQRT